MLVLTICLKMRKYSLKKKERDALIESSMNYFVANKKNYIFRVAKSKKIVD